MRKNGSPTKWVVAGGVVVVVSLVAATLVATRRDSRARAAVRSGSSTVMLELKNDIDGAGAAMHAFNGAGGLDLSGLEDKASLEKRIAAAATAQAAVERVLSRGDEAPRRLGELLPSVPAAQMEQAKRQLSAAMNWSEGRQIFLTHRRAYAAARAQLEFMHKHHGDWRVDAVGMSVNWNSPQLQAQAQRLAEEVDAARAAQAALSSPPAAGSASPTATTRPR